jgi:hypothetical protein
LILVAWIIGCGGHSGPAESPEAAHIGKVGQLINDFKAANSGNNPKNLDDLKNWAVKNGKGADTDFVSTRDHEPYVIVPLALSRGGGAPAMSTGPSTSKGPLIIHEATGKNGKKFVVQGVAPVGSEMTDEGLRYLTQGPQAGKNNKSSSGI